MAEVAPEHAVLRKPTLLLRRNIVSYSADVEIGLRGQIRPGSRFGSVSRVDRMIAEMLALNSVIYLSHPCRYAEL